MNIKLRHDMNLTAGIYYNNVMRMNLFQIQINLLTNCDDGESQSTALSRIKYFVNNELDSTIFICSDQQDKCNAYINAELKITTLPASPVDQVIGIMLYHKLNAITEKRLLITKTEISSVWGDNIIYFYDNTDDIDIMKEPGWWNDANLIHYNNELIKNNNIISMNNSNIWRKLNLQWPDKIHGEKTNSEIVFPNFTDK